jgi:hypothetical protein
MNLKYKKQSSCPEDEQLLAYRTNLLTEEERQAVVLHLLFCDACLESLRFLPDNANEDQRLADYRQGRGMKEISHGLAEALAKFREREAIRTAHPPKTIEQMEQDGGLRVGQIWRTKLDGIVVPGSESREKLSISDFDSRPHLVVITDVESAEVSPHKDWSAILVAPVSGDIEFADKDEGDFVVDQKISPLGYPFMIELWNEQSMLRENLDCCLSELDTSQCETMLEQLQQEREKVLMGEKGPSSLETVVMNGRYQDPIMRFRAHEHEETLYLRQPVEALKEVKSKLITFPFRKVSQNREVSEKWVLPLAAATTSNEDHTSTSNAAPATFGSFRIGEIEYEVVEDSEGRVYLLGVVPPDATHLCFGPDCYVLKQTRFGDMREINGVGSIKVERFLRQHELDSANYPVHFARL